MQNSYPAPGWRDRSVVFAVLAALLLCMMSTAARATSAAPPRRSEVVAPASDPSPGPDGGGAAIATIASVAFSTSMVRTGIPFDIIVTLSDPAPAGGVTVDLTISPSNGLPSSALPSLTIAEGQSTGRITHLVQGITDSLLDILNVCATAGGNSVCQAIAVEPAQGLVSFSISPSQAQSGSTLQGRITLSRALSTPLELTGELMTSADNSPVSFPQRIVIPAGEMTKQFPITTSPHGTESFSALYYQWPNGTASVTLSPPPLAFLVPPGAAWAGIPFNDQPVVIFAGTDGNPLPRFNELVTLSVKGGPGHLTGTTTVRAVDGVARFTDVGVDQPGAGYRLSATSPWYGPQTEYSSAPFDVSARPDAVLTGLDFGGQLTMFYDVPFTGVVSLSAPAVTPVTVDLALKESINPSLQLIMPPSVTIPSGAQTAAFTIIATGGSMDSHFTMSASANGTSVWNFVNIAVMRGLRSMTVTPRGVVGGGSATAEMRLELLVPHNGRVQVVASYAAGDGGSMIPIPGFPTAPFDFVAGEDSKAFAIVAPTPMEWQNYKISASVSGGTVWPVGPVSDNLFVAPRALKFTMQPGAAVLTKPFPVNPVVVAPGANGQPNPQFNGYVTIALDPAAGNPMGVLDGTKRVKAVNGVATFTDLSIDRPGAGYVLVAEYDSYTTSGAATQPNMPVTRARSAPFNVQDIPMISALQLNPNYIQTRGSVAANVELTGAFPSQIDPPITFTAERQAGWATSELNFVPSTPLMDPTRKIARYTISNKEDATEWKRYEIRARLQLGSTISPDGVRDLFVAPRALKFTTQPSGAVPGQPFAVQPVVISPNAAGQPYGAPTGAVEIRLDPNTGTPGAKLTGATLRGGTNGTISFTDLAIDKPGTGYVLVAEYDSYNGVGAGSVPGLPVTQVRSTPFNVGSPEISMLTFSAYPAYYTLPFTGTVTLKQPAPPGSPVTVQLSVDSYNGGMGGSLTIPPTVTVPAGATSATFTIVANGRQVQGGGSICASVGSSQWCESFLARPFPMPYRMQVSPTRVVGGRSVTATVTLEEAMPAGGTLVVDTYCRTQSFDGQPIPAPGFPSSITFNGGEKTKSFTFQTLPEVNYWKRYVVQAYAESTGQTDPVDGELYAGPPPLQVAGQPGAATAGQPFILQPVIIGPAANGQPNPQFNGNVTITLDTATGTPGAKLTGTTTVQAVNGVARFTNLAIDKPGSGYVLQADYAAPDPPYNALPTKARTAPLVVATPAMPDIPHTTSTMVMDGNITAAEWTGAAVIPLGDPGQDLNPGFWSGTNDYAGAVQLKWNPQAVYVAANVTDDVLKLHPSDINSAPEYDGLSLYLGLANPLNPSRTVYDASDFHIRMQPWGPGPDGGSVLLTKVPVQEPVFLAMSRDVHWKRTSTGYTMEAYVYWHTLGIPAAPVAGQTIGINLVAHDYDARAPQVDSEFSFTRLPGSDTNPKAWTTAVLLPPPFIAGDVDGDGQVTMHDAAVAAGQAAGLTAIEDISKLDVAPRTAPGVYGDGKVDLLDVVRILRHVSGLEADWPG